MKFVNKILFVGKIFFVFVIVQSYVFARDPQKELMSKDTDLKLSSDDKLVRETNKLQKATVTVEKIKNDATTIKDAAKENFDKGKITRAQFAKIIGEQDYIIHQADKKLAQLIDNSIKKFEKIDAEEGYLTQILAPFRSGYGYTQEEKDRARSVISELKKQQLEINRAYTEEIKNIFQKDKRDLFKNNYDNLMKEF
ncbi:MAG TPA: hypothetical protein VLB80_02865 [Candidatus Babeliales bacterium]|nr:hypothetical protein [Candidatus Babeliales bacterium]